MTGPAGPIASGSHRADRVPVVLLHAFPLHSTMWDAQRHVLTRTGHPVIAPDQRGFGAAVLGTGPPSLPAVVGDLARSLDSGGVRRAVLVGCSMGGYVAMAFLRRHPDRVLGLALLATRAEADTPETAAARERFAHRVLQDGHREELLADTVPLLVGSTTLERRTAVVERLTADVMAAPARSMAWAQRAMAARPCSLDVLHRADVPAVVIAGDEDRLVRPDEAQRLTAVLPRGRLVVVPGAGHLTPLEAPARVTTALLGLLDAVGGAGEGARARR
ncbi:alpha/beta fold hydrolase [Streptomyces sp. NK08204]|uniref:alpha/beta fold hydrolase n=1 Tax=Streptomyces sp. NK08204 TaxID=2873260 RepID=UPI001CED7E91|nr:alpha/beta hydrolase [Streptomyces sp. NK08204]